MTQARTGGRTVPGNLIFQKMLDFSSQRNAKEALLLYLAYLVFVVLCSAIVGMLFGLLAGGSPQATVTAGAFTSSVVTFTLAILFLDKKKLAETNFMYLILALTTPFLAFFGGGLIGLVPVAYLATRPAAVPKT